MTCLNPNTTERAKSAYRSFIYAPAPAPAPSPSPAPPFAPAPAPAPRYLKRLMRLQR